MDQHPDKSRGAGSPETVAAAGPPGEVEPAIVPSQGRRWLFRIFTLIILPLLLLAGLEMSLRLAGYGYPTGFFKKIRVGDADYFIYNESFSRRFFPPQLARWPDSFLFPAVKAPDTIRVFIFGESAAMGDPQPAYGAGRYLDVLLRGRYPQKKFEVINTGITAIDSHVILPIARECARHDGDFWIIYMGNNEMVGPYGAATVFGAKALPRWAARSNLAIQQTCTGQLLVAGLRKLGGKSENTSWGGMEMFLENQVAPGDPRKETVYRNFAGNLRDIVAAGVNSGAKVILNTVSVNLRDCPPFASFTDSNLPAAGRQHFDQIFAGAKSLQSQSDFLAAADEFAQAVKLEPQYAEAHFRLGQCELALTNADARKELQIACDDDALPFRADTPVNSAIRQEAQQHAGNRLVLCDAEKELAQASGPAGIAGDETFFEHVHFNFDGNYRLGRIWAEQIGQMLAATGTTPATTNWLSPAACDRALGLSIWNRQFVLQTEIRRMDVPPLSAQFNNRDRTRKLREEELLLRQKQAEPGAVQQVRDEFAAALKNSPQDGLLYEGLANFLEAVHDPQGSVAAYRRVLETRPDDFYALLQLGRMLGEQGQPEQGEIFLESAVHLRPDQPEGWFKLGIVLAAQQKFAPARECLERAIRLQPQDASYVCYLGEILDNLNRHADAMALYQRAIRMNPGQWEAHLGLANDLVAASQLEAAGKEYAEVIRLKPDYALAHLNLGAVQARTGRFDEALRQFNETLRLEPGNPQAQEYIDLVEKAQNSGR